MVMHSLLSLSREIFGDIEIGKLGWFDQIGVNFEGEGTEISIVDALAGHDVLFDVLAEAFDNEMELCFGFKRLDGFKGSGLGFEMLAGIVIGMVDNPELR
jgi:hypothetical protein